MRALLAAALLVLAAPTALALVPTACAEGNTTHAQGSQWTVTCLRILSGDAILFTSGDTVPHNARSSQDDQPTLRALGPACFHTDNFGLGGSARVRFVHDSSGVTASVRQADGSWGPAVDCDLARDPLSLASSDAVIAFECGIHQSMTGRIVIRSI